MDKQATMVQKTELKSKVHWSIIQNSRNVQVRKLIVKSTIKIHRNNNENLAMSCKYSTDNSTKRTGWTEQTAVPFLLL